MKKVQVKVKRVARQTGDSRQKGGSTSHPATLSGNRTRITSQRLPVVGTVWATKTPGTAFRVTFFKKVGIYGNSYPR
jgi:hypothetical protein